MVGDRGGEANWTQIREGCAKMLGIWPDKHGKPIKDLKQGSKVITLWMNVHRPHLPSSVGLTYHIPRKMTLLATVFELLERFFSISEIFFTL